MNERITKLFEKKSLIQYRERFRKSLLRLGHGGDAEDCAQDFFLRVLEGKSKHQTVDQFAIDYLRERYGGERVVSRHQRKAFEHAGSFEQGNFDQTIGHCVGAVLHDRIDLIRMVRLLNGRDKRIAEQRFIWGMSESEIADCHQITESRVSQILKRVQGRLSARVKEAESRKGRARAREMAGVCQVPWQGMEFETHIRMAFEEPREMVSAYEARFEEWIA